MEVRLLFFQNHSIGYLFLHIKLHPTPPRGRQRHHAQLYLEAAVAQEAGQKEITHTHTERERGGYRQIPLTETEKIGGTPPHSIGVKGTMRRAAWPKRPPSQFSHPFPLCSFTYLFHIPLVSLLMMGKRIAPLHTPHDMFGYGNTAEENMENIK